jgi:ribosomal protein S18 acetylase RimI-like enzyme
MREIRDLTADDIGEIATAFAQLGWNKPASQYEAYLDEMQHGDRHVLVARQNGAFAGYVTIVWKSPYPPFESAGIAEIQDFNVLPDFRRRGIGTALMDEAESIVAGRSQAVGLGVGFDPDYGPAQRLYVLRGYVPDARGGTSHGRWVKWGDQVRVDDDLVLYFVKSLEA